MNNPDLDVSKKDGKVINCLHCNNETYMHLISTYNRFWNSEENLIWEDDTWNLFLCPVCSGVTLEHISIFSEDLDYEYSPLHDEPVRKPRIAILYPAKAINSLPAPHEDLPDELLADYEEARSIAHLSPRGSAALLRLVLQKLSKHLGAKGTNINEDIKYLVNEGLPQRLQQAFDIVRIIGNNAVHPGYIDLNDNIEIVHKLFTLINIITEHLITQPKMISKLYDDLPKGQLKSIEKRNKTTKP
ncbi:DUF4145 domain-containing protein [Propionispora vibrioides]|uniref:DUF4145 domain-containing protein n=1 Tax=Propionispora vibrioides TaxID=112903 RepID=A0A1H8Y418_9FIRM|nr:DUF4145 domain-containing protein [Propionispora vibrioides]SEP46849.1 protein of unknown function [Propionispora vibrioides]